MVKVVKWFLLLALLLGICVLLMVQGGSWRDWLYAVGCAVVFVLGVFVRWLIWSRG